MAPFRAPVPTSLRAQSLLHLPPRPLAPTRLRPPTKGTILTTPPQVRHSSHEIEYDPPTGNLWGLKPGEKYEKEGWEDIWFYGFWGSFAFAAVAYAFKPDTSIQTWALEEARRRLEKEGLLEDPEGSKTD